VSNVALLCLQVAETTGVYEPDSHTCSDSRQPLYSMRAKGNTSKLITLQQDSAPALGKAQAPAALPTFAAFVPAHILTLPAPAPSPPKKACAAHGSTRGCL
jgi:hypothetical protein